MHYSSVCILVPCLYFINQIVIYYNLYVHLDVSHKEIISGYILMLKIKKNVYINIGLEMLELCLEIYFALISAPMESKAAIIWSQNCISSSSQENCKTSQNGVNKHLFRFRVNLQYFVKLMINKYNFVFVFGFGFYNNFLEQYCRYTSGTNLKKV